MGRLPKHSNHLVTISLAKVEFALLSSEHENLSKYSVDHTCSLSIPGESGTAMSQRRYYHFPCLVVLVDCFYRRVILGTCRRLNRIERIFIIFSGPVFPLLNGGSTVYR